MSRAGAEREHPDIDRLADLDAGLLDPAAEHELRGHLTGCAECGDVLRILDETRQALSGLPTETMPGELAARLDAALAAEAEQPREAATSGPTGGEVAPLRRGRTDEDGAGAGAGTRRSWTPRLAAAGIAVLAAAAVGVGLTLANGSHGGGTSGAGAGGAKESRSAGTGTSGPEVIASGRDYTPITLVPGVRALLRPGGTKPQTVPHAQPGQQLPNGRSGGPVQPSSPGATAVLTDPAQRRACLAALAGGPGGRPIVVDRATYEGKPAAVIVLAGPKPSTVVVDVVGPHCGTAGPDLLVRRTVHRS